MKSNIKKKAYRLEERKVKRAKAFLKTDTETAAIDAALDLVLRIKKIKSVPKFRREAEEREFWSVHDTTEYFDFSKAHIFKIRGIARVTENPARAI
jgi:hypothetical protein